MDAQLHICFPVLMYVSIDTACTNGVLQQHAGSNHCVNMCQLSLKVTASLSDMTLFPSVQLHPDRNLGFAYYLLLGLLPVLLHCGTCRVLFISPRSVVCCDMHIQVVTHNIVVHLILSAFAAG